ncbi:DNA alkylation repair protein [Prevotella brunnea]|uniref:DNA alkylation repair protein n=1 Tax=Prevotella brunnea TaxID=2508867 RepID=A0A5C8GIW4_9BACT|nr:DNA alkylation repair protein [Prevotella brunnea]MDR0186609.1 DNA alkylation repair protein [Prevotella brunnea]TXJ61867.1 DNA alkylation repair protein [Prevotella brunnea]
MNEEKSETLKEIKRSFRLFMDGATSSSMRKKGLNYKINWGIPLPSLRKISKGYGKNFDLAIELWKEPIRECKIMATYIMPAERMSRELVDVWMEAVDNQELAELIAFNLLKNLSFAPSLAYEYIASEKKMLQICGYQLLAALFADGKEPNERGINEFLDQVQTALKSGEMGIKHSAYNCVCRFCELGDIYEQVAIKALSEFDLL